jgi:hypothetical protein
LTIACATWVRRVLLGVLSAIQYEDPPHGVAFMVACSFALLTAPIVAYARTSDSPKRRGAREILF